MEKKASRPKKQVLFLGNSRPLFSSLVEKRAAKKGFKALWTVDIIEARNMVMEKDNNISLTIIHDDISPDRLKAFVSDIKNLSPVMLLCCHDRSVYERTEFLEQLKKAGCHSFLPYETIFSPQSFFRAMREANREFNPLTH